MIACPDCYSTKVIELDPDFLKCTYCGSYLRRVSMSEVRSTNRPREEKKDENFATSSE